MRRSLSLGTLLCLILAIGLMPLAGCRAAVVSDGGAGSASGAQTTGSGASPNATGGDASGSGSSQASDPSPAPILVTEFIAAAGGRESRTWVHAAPGDDSTLAVGYGLVQVSLDAAGVTDTKAATGAILATTGDGARIEAEADYYTFTLTWPSAPSGSLEVTLDAAALPSCADKAGVDGLYHFTLTRRSSPTVVVTCLDEPEVGLPYVGPRSVARVPEGPKRFQLVFSEAMEQAPSEEAVRRNASLPAWPRFPSEKATCRFQWLDDRTLVVTMEPEDGEGLLQVCAAGARDTQGRTLWDTDTLRVSWNRRLEVVSVAVASGSSQTEPVCQAPPGVRPCAMSPGGKHLLGLETDISPALGQTDSHFRDYFAWVYDTETDRWRDLAQTGAMGDAYWIGDERLLIPREGGWSLLDVTSGEKTQVNPDTPAGFQYQPECLALLGDKVIAAVGQDPLSLPGPVQHLARTDLVVYNLDGAQQAVYPDVTKCIRGEVWEQVPLAWTPDGQGVVFVHREDQKTLIPARLNLADGSLQTYPGLGPLDRSNTPMTYSPGVGLEGESSPPTYCGVAVGWYSGPVRTAVFDLGSGQVLFTIQGSGECRPSPTGNTLAITSRRASGSTGQTVRLCNGLDGRPLVDEPLAGWALGWSDDGLRLYVARPGP